MRIPALLTLLGLLASHTGTVPPYVQAGTPTSMVVIWTSATAVPATLKLADATGRPLRELHNGSAVRHLFRLTGLTPGTTYHYQAFDGSRPVASSTFHTNNGPDESRFRFAVMGDSGSGNANQYAVAHRVTVWKPDFVIHTGDVVYERGAASDYLPNFVAPYHDLIAGTVIYPTLGNHDYGTQHGQPYLNFFELPPPPGSHDASPPAVERWYTFDYGNAQFWGLDSNARSGPGSAQYEWLKASLAKSNARWKIAYFHHPLYSSGWEGSSVELRGTWGRLFTQNHVQVVFNGHDHDYERITPEGGVQYIVTGGAGAWLRKMKRSPFTAFEKVTYHFVGVTVDGDRLSAEAIDSHGQTIDRWSVSP